MRLHRLEITAFGPFAGHEVVDFEVLNQAGVFLLNGETGAGKTSVLDAVCFALYGTGPTTSGKGGRKAQHSDHAEPHTAPRVQVEFTASGRRWCVTRTPAWREPSTRASSGWSERHATVLLREYVDGQWTERGYRPDDVGQTIQHAVGLDREQFTQVMMLPQGRFARFLQAGSKEREQLLETLFGTDVYADVQVELKTRADSARAELASALQDAHRSDDALRRTRERLALALDELPEEVREAAAAGLEAVAEGPPAVNRSSREQDPDQAPGEGGPASGPQDSGGGEDPEELSERWRTLVADCAQVVALFERARDRAAEAHTAAQKRSAHLESTGALVQRHTRLAGRLAEVTADAKTLETAVRRLAEHAAAQELDEPVRAAEDARRRAAEAEAAVADLRAHLVGDHEDALSMREVLRGRPEVLGELQGAPELPRGLRDAAVSAREAAKGAVVTAQELAEEERQLQRDQDRVESLRVSVERAEKELGSLRPMLAELEDAQRELATEVKDEALVRERARAARQAVESSRTYARARRTEQERARSYESAEQARRTAAHRVEALEARRYAGAAASLAQELVDGQPCPVCGSSEHPRPAAGDPEQHVTEHVLDTARSERDTAQAAADDAHARWQSAQRASIECLERGAEEDLDAVVERERRAHLAEQALDDALSRLRVGEQRILSTRESVADLESSIARQKIEMTGVSSTVESSLQRCGRTREALTALLGSFPDARGFLRAAEELARLVERWEDAQRCLDTARQQQRSTQDALRRVLGRSPFTTVAEVERALLDAREAAELSDWVAARRDEVSRLEAELATEDMQRMAQLTETERAEFSADAVRRAAADRGDQERRRDRLNQQLGGVEALWADARSHAQHAPEHEAAVSRARVRADRLSGLADVATATSSENSLRMTLTSFVLAAKLEQVASVASEHLSRMSSGRFSLVHTDQTRGGGKSGLGLEIDDAWTGARRGTETLSGGESFFTSLALALALADVVRSEAGGTEIDTLFVDEGFGSLDEQTLEQVLETLDGLRRDGRVIGVVSHVSEMKQRIDAQLVVTKTPSGSHLRVEAGPWGVHVG